MTDEEVKALVGRLRTMVAESCGDDEDEPEVSVIAACNLIESLSRDLTAAKARIAELKCELHANAVHDLERLP